MQQSSISKHVTLVDFSHTCLAKNFTNHSQMPHARILISLLAANYHLSLEYYFYSNNQKETKDSL